MTIKREIGQKVSYSGFNGTIIEVCEWAPSMVVIRLRSGDACVTFSDLKEPVNLQMFARHSQTRR